VRVIARTTIVEELRGESSEPEQYLEDQDIRSALGEERGQEARAAWTEFWNGFKVDDPNQPVPHVLSLPVRSGSAWLRVYRGVADNVVGVFLGFKRGTVGEDIDELLLKRFEAADKQSSRMFTENDYGERYVGDVMDTGPLNEQGSRDEAFVWLRSRTNDFVNALREELPSALKKLGAD
jgi:hypothetical protein